MRTMSRPIGSGYGDTNGTAERNSPTWKRIFPRGLLEPQGGLAVGKSEAGGRGGLVTRAGPVGSTPRSGSGGGV